jgi:hypothetical protein
VTRRQDTSRSDRNGRAALGRLAAAREMHGGRKELKTGTVAAIKKQLGLQ